MTGRRNLPSAIVSATMQSGVADVATEIAETVLDARLDQSLLREIPIISTISAGLRAAASIRDAIFIRKLALFLSNLDRFTEEDRAAFASRLDRDQEERNRTGTQLLILLDSFSDEGKPALLATIFSAYVRGDIGREDYDLLAEAVASVNLNLLTSIGTDPRHFSPGEGLVLVNVGLLDVRFTIGELTRGRNEYDNIGQATPEFSRTPLGDKLAKILDRTPRHCR